jgi:ribonuclease HII
MAEAPTMSGLRVAGVDEAGRGPLAGPVFAAAVVLPPGFEVGDIDDSKKLDRATRERLAEVIMAECEWYVAQASVEEIDRLNILWASMLAMERAVCGLGRVPDEALIDGNRLPRALPCRGRAIVDGDALEPAIAAASILAKTARDAHMREIGLHYPGYGFERNFGYPTPDHLTALRELGPSPVHRLSFAPCRPDSQLCLNLDAS